MVLPQQLWPLSSSIPDGKGLSNYDQFKDKYLEKHQKKKLSQFIPYLGTCTLSFKNKVEFECSGLVAQFLLCFNEKQSWKKEDIQAKIAIGSRGLEVIMEIVGEVGIVKEQEG